MTDTDADDPDGDTQRNLLAGPKMADDRIQAVLDAMADADVTWLKSSRLADDLPMSSSEIGQVMRTLRAYGKVEPWGSTGSDGVAWRLVDDDTDWDSDADD